MEIAEISFEVKQIPLAFEDGTCLPNLFPQEPDAYLFIDIPMITRGSDTFYHDLDQRTYNIGIALDIRHVPDRFL